MLDGSFRTPPPLPQNIHSSFILVSIRYTFSDQTLFTSLLFPGTLLGAGGVEMKNGPVFNGKTGVWTNDDTMASQLIWEREAQGIQLG